MQGGGDGGGAHPGRIVSESSSARDATNEYVDVVARERSQRTALAQVRRIRGPFLCRL